MSRSVSWKQLCEQAEGGLMDKVMSYQFSGRTFYEGHNAIYEDIDLYPSNILYPEDDLYPDGE